MIFKKKLIKEEIYRGQKQLIFECLKPLLHLHMFFLSNPVKILQKKENVSRSLVSLRLCKIHVPPGFMIW